MLTVTIPIGSENTDAQLADAIHRTEWLLAQLRREQSERTALAAARQVAACADPDCGGAHLDIIAQRLEEESTQDLPAFADVA